MASKRRKTSKSRSRLFNPNTLKVILGLVATSSFAIAFGQEQIQNLVSLPSTSNAACLNQFYRDIPPYLVKQSLTEDTYPLCFNGFSVMYSGVSKTPLWVAEALTPQRLSQKIPREDSFHEEKRLKAEHRATLADYKASGYDRGHMAPNADMPTTAAQSDSFSLANMVPQAPKNNQQVWRELEEATRAMVSKQKQDVYVVTGPLFAAKKLKTIGKGVIVPTAVFKAIYIPKTGVIGAYYAPNDNSLQVKVVSVCYLEEQLGINLFPQLTEEQKRNTYDLPLNSRAVRANQKIAYSHWDAESQCAEEVSSAKLTALQKAFKSASAGSSSSISTPSSTSKNAESSSTADSSTLDIQNTMVKPLIEGLLPQILQWLK